MIHRWMASYGLSLLAHIILSLTSIKICITSRYISQQQKIDKTSFLQLVEEIKLSDYLFK